MFFGLRPVARLRKGVFRTTYECGYPRPLTRGWIHLAMAPVWYAAWAWTLLFTHQSRGVSVLFASKFMCYFASAMYHCMDTEGLPGLHDLLYRLDVVMIGMAIWAPYAPLADQDNDLGRSMLGMLCCIFMAACLFKPKDGNRSWLFPLYFVCLLYTSPSPRD